MAEQLDLDGLRRSLYRELLQRGLTAGIPRYWIAQIVRDFHHWWPNPPLHVIEHELALLANRAGVDLVESPKR